MSYNAIEVENLGKCYQIGELENYYTLRDSLTNIFKFPIKLIANNGKIRKKSEIEYIWALKDINFQVKHGEIIGIIGRNGAGKSTLLKILSRITTPTEGKVKINGRVGSLLEVGTGFHPELTGRENIFLNGSILGMYKKEIERKFDEIVDFAEIEKFLDTPVKRYSSGMYVRLAFAVAAHLEPEILLVDEVLAVGDNEFQKKCLGKMSEVTNNGITVLFVSHNLTSISNLCSSTLVIDSGRIVFDGQTENAVGFYMKNQKEKANNIPLSSRTDRIGSGIVRMHNAAIIDSLGDSVNNLRSGENYTIEIDYINNTNNILNNVVCSIDIYDVSGNRLLMLRTDFTNSNLKLDDKKGKIQCFLENLPLAIGDYYISLFLSYSNDEIIDMINHAIYFQVGGGDYFGTGSMGKPLHCKILHHAKWGS